MNVKNLLGVKEALEYLGVSKTTFYYHRNLGRIPSHETPYGCMYDKRGLLNFKKKWVTKQTGNAHG